jgi:hypothetical protein
MTPEQLKPFVDMAARDSDRFDREWAEFQRRSLAAGQASRSEGALNGAAATMSGGFRQQPPQLQALRQHVAQGVPTLHPVFIPNLEHVQHPQPGTPIRHHQSQLQAQLTPMQRHASLSHLHGQQHLPMMHPMGSMPAGFPVMPYKPHEAEELDQLCHYQDRMDLSEQQRSRRQQQREQQEQQHMEHQQQQANTNSFLEEYGLNDNGPSSPGLSPCALVEPTDHWNSMSELLREDHDMPRPSIDAFIDCSVQVNRSNKAHDGAADPKTGLQQELAAGLMGEPSATPIKGAHGRHAAAYNGGCDQAAHRGSTTGNHAHLYGLDGDDMLANSPSLVGDIFHSF